MFAVSSFSVLLNKGGNVQQGGRALQAGDILIVIHDFEARSGDELTLRRSDRVQLIELDDGFSDGWYLGKHLTKGTTGLFPGVYTTRAPAVRTPGHSPSPSFSQQRGSFSSQPDRPPTARSAAITNATTDTHAENDANRSSLPAAHHTTYVQRSIGETLGNDTTGSDSPVMNETLNAVDEHITDLSTPRQMLNIMRVKDDSESEYSAHLDRRSFVTGADTDDDEGQGLDESTVRAWDHIQTSQHLRDLGVDSKHCEIFREQEITGDVLLDMDQNFIYMQEFDFGVMGRRLKTWHKVRDFQREVKSTPRSRQSSDKGLGSSIDDGSRSTRGGSSARPSYTAPIAEEGSDFPYPLQPIQQSKRTSWAAPASSTHWQATMPPDSPTKNGAPTRRRSRRHSSIDFGGQPDLGFSAIQPSSPQKKSSTTGSWSMPGTGSTQATTPTSSIRPSNKAEDLLGFPSPSLQDEFPSEFDRGYFSGNDIDDRKRHRLSKISQRGHTRQVSEQQSKRASMIKRHARLSSAGSIREDSAFASPAANAYYNLPPKIRFRSSSARATSGQSSPAGLTPTVTNLENDTTPIIGSPALEKMRMQDRARKLMGFRATSEAITPDERSNAMKLTSSTDTPRTSDIVASPTTGDSTPSATPSLDMESSDQVDVTAALGKSSLRPRPKNKQRTSAYTHGLLKIPPSEARKLCDYSGWMKKKSSGIMTTWKPRLFILRGRRLSYYYSENDTEERGIIDISGHKVLVANDDPIITIHASVTGASKASSTPRPDGSAAPPGKSTTGVFYFKLVPPKTGMSRAVQFTKPAVHYFQVDTITEGRKWMGEIMKATIEHDLATFETTNKQKTISLAKARARKERPPELDDTKAKEDPKQSGLGIDISEPVTSVEEKRLSGASNTSAKALSVLGLGPKTSFEKKQLDDLANIIEEDKENSAVPVTTAVPETKA